jgi:hypothetical protein
MANMITGIISITIGALVLASVYMTSIKNTTQSATGYYANGTYGATIAWSASEVAMWGLLGLLGVVGILYGTLSIFGLA